MWHNRWIVATTLLILTASPTIAYGHPTQGLWQQAWWKAWHWDGLVMANLFVLALVYGCGRRVQRSAIAKRDGWVDTTWMTFVLSLLVIGLSLQSPLDVLGESLGWVHMVQHMLLMSVAAPWFVLGRPMQVVVWAIPRSLRKRAMVRGGLRLVHGTRSRQFWCNPWFAFGLHTTLLWGWHHPWLYEAALNDQLTHDVEHMSMFIGAVIFWQAMLVPMHSAKSAPALNLLLLFATSVLAMGLGVLMTLAPRVWYVSYVGRTELWGWTPLEDQQLAGAIMWMPACSVYPIAACVLLAKWLVQLDSARSGDRHALGSMSKRL